MSRFLFPRQFFYVSMVKNCGSLARDWYGDLLKIGDFQLTDTDFKQKKSKKKINTALSEPGSNDS